MIIQCTKKLLQEINKDPVKPGEENALFSWHANLIRLNRRKTAVLVNDKNRYVLVLYGMKAKDFKEFSNHLKNGIKYTFQAECIKEDIVYDFINNSREFIFTKTKNRSLVAKMNQACKEINYFQELLNDNSLYQPEVSKKISRRPVSDGSGDYLYPNREMYQDLKEYFGMNIFGCRAVKLKIDLKLENHNIWRKLVIPLSYNFTDLHKAIQTVFNWQNRHLHEFIIYDKSQKKELSPNHFASHQDNIKPVINIISPYEEIYEEDKDVELLREGGIKLAEYLPAPVKYNYDYGDDWQHYIEVEEIIDDYDKNYPICPDGEGKAPPEDVGGEYGYEDLLDILEKEDHPQHSNMVTWAKSQRFEEFDIEKVNKKLKREFQ